MTQQKLAFYNDLKWVDIQNYLDNKFLEYNWDYNDYAPEVKGDYWVFQVPGSLTIADEKALRRMRDKKTRK